jgi:small subunit ribosomal protein S1
MTKKSWEEEFAGDAGLDEQEGKKSQNEFASMFEASMRKSTKKLSVGEKIKGEILVIGSDDVYVSTGTQHDGAVSRRELLDAEGKVPYKVGDKIDLYVTMVKGSDIRLSPNPTAKNIADDLEDAFDMMLPVEGRVAEVVKGGVRVNIHGKLAFCPISQLDSKFIESAEEYVGKKFEFRITKFSGGGRDIVVSRKLLLSEQKEMGEGTFLSEHKPGDIVSGTVRRLEKFGAFIELAPGVDGLAHISELSWSRVSDPAEVLQVGQDVKVKFIKTETDAQGRTRISLSIKQAGEQPWDNLPAGLSPGASVEGKVTRLANFGAFVELAPGIEGLLPIGQMSEKRIKHPSEVVKEGQKLQVRLVSLDPASKRISLSIKDSSASADPDAENWRDYKQAPASLGSLGGAFGAQLQKAMDKKRN